MNKPIAIVFLVAGIVLLVFGFTSADSIGSHITKFFSGHPTDKAMWLLIGGAVCTAIGLIGLARTGKA